MKLSDYLDAPLPNQSNNSLVLFKHANNTDIAFQLDTISKQTNTWRLGVTWYNVVNLTNIFQLGYDVIQIKNSDLHKWESINVQAARILRDNL